MKMLFSPQKFITITKTPEITKTEINIKTKPNMTNTSKIMCIVNRVILIGVFSQGDFILCENHLILSTFKMSDQTLFFMFNIG